MSSKLSLTPPSGFVEYSTIDQKNFDHLKNTIEKVYKSHGFVGTQTPVVEHLDNLLAKGACDQEVFTLGRLGQETETQMGLRFDLTVPFARYVAAHQTHIAFPFKRYQIDSVFRGERPQAGRYRQFYQADIDIIAPEKLSEDHDAYVLHVLHDALSSIGIDDVTYLVNHRELLETMASTLCASDNQHPEFFRLLDKKEKISADLFNQELKKIVQHTKADEFCCFLDEVSEQSFEQTLKSFTLFIKKQAGDVSESLVEKLLNFKEHIEILGIPASSCRLSLSTARGLNYYTGIVFETIWHRFEKLGSIASGGRYDNLVGQFSKRSYPGIGLSIGLSRIFSVYQQMMQNQKKSEKSGLLIVVPKEQKKNLKYFYSFLKLLKKNFEESDVQHSVELYLQDKKVQDQKKYALAKDLRWTCELSQELLDQLSELNPGQKEKIEEMLMSENSHFLIKDYTLQTMSNYTYEQLGELCG